MVLVYEGEDECEWKGEGEGRCGYGCTYAYLYVHVYGYGNGHGCTSMAWFLTAISHNFQEVWGHLGSFRLRFESRSASSKDRTR